MLTLLGAFLLSSVVMPVLVRWMGARAFFIAALIPAGAFVHALMLTPQVLHAASAPYESVEWIPQLGLNMSMHMDVLGWVLTLIVTGVGALVLLYCRWYFHDDSVGLGQFAAVLLGFAGAMYGLVLTDDLVMLVMFWEVTSILSYLLIGYYRRRAASRRAALQALLVTTLGGLVMFVGVVLLVVDAGTSSIREILALAPTGPIVDAAIVMLLVGAISKSALFPFHFWLPGAMAAPTPVSAYLHAAAMVKAGIYLIARFAPIFAFSGPWRPILISLGVFTMLLGGVQALRETDLKRILAFGTVSQLGFFSVVIGYGTQAAALAGLALVIAHALFKSALFLIVGVIDRQLSTRDVTELSGVGRQAPVLAVTAFISVASMAGIAPTIGFVAKESALTALLDDAQGGSVWGLVALIGIVLGSMLTAAYGARFLWGAFFSKRDAQGERMPDTAWPGPPLGFVAAPIVLAALTLAAGIGAPALDAALQGYAVTATPGLDHAGEAAEGPGHLALWHGLEPALGISIVSILLGIGVFLLTRRTGWERRPRVLPFTAADAYYAVVRAIDRLSVLSTTLTQRGSLPVYVGTIFVVFVAAEATALLASDIDRIQLSAWHTPAQIAAAPLMAVAGIFAVRAQKRYTGVVLVSVTGLGMVALFATSGAPDLALTQILVETVTMVTFALVLRRLPSRMGEHNASVGRIPRALLGIGVGVTMALVAIVATQSRVAEPISTLFPKLAYELGHGKNVVNVALVDLRGWDTMGELSVLVLAATGVASLVFVTHRADLLAATKTLPKATRRATRSRPLVETTDGIRFQTSENRSSPRAWLVGGTNMKPENRSILLEVIVRILFHTIIVVSIFLLFSGHNLPGGGFAGGLVAGMALVMRYIAGGRWELGAAAPTDAGRLLGTGLVLAVGSAVVPLFFGLAPLTSRFWEWELPGFGHMEFVTSTIFDIGVYLVVIGLVLDVLRSLGAEVDRQAAALRSAQDASTPSGTDRPRGVSI
ncbi:Na(+)/H(+) antiporter subunit A [Microbacterium hydrocarbonoxydans]|uniref:Na(+)/H(+) antiporter subunit A n=1 Tax=Microbacterium hydrocarbonoxydans TaxID=273678 RepID=A0A0M2HUV8_9MICO|nr:Na+/H+ antiporter subunit A [Microbacterium hydrocarbonoxydans]KJL48228.1 Na(+)/H(+) antiporter subunit A [Microbacterium hydrocarbonoxydans]